MSQSKAILAALKQRGVAVQAFDGGFKVQADGALVPMSGALTPHLNTVNKNNNGKLALLAGGAVGAMALIGALNRFLSKKGYPKHLAVVRSFNAKPEVNEQTLLNNTSAFQKLSEAIDALHLANNQISSKITGGVNRLASMDKKTGEMIKAGMSDVAKAQGHLVAGMRTVYGRAKSHAAQATDPAVEKAYARAIKVMQSSIEGIVTSNQGKFTNQYGGDVGASLSDFISSLNDLKKFRASHN